MPLPPKSAAGWLPRRTPGLAEPGPKSGAGKTGAGGSGWSVGLLEIPGAPGSSGPSRSPARRSQATRSIPSPARRRSAFGAPGSGPGPAPGSCSDEHRGGMRIARARAKGEGAARPRSPSPPCAPHPARAPRTFARGFLDTPSPPQVCKAAPRRQRARRLCGAASRANRTTAPGLQAQAQASAHTRSRGLAPPQPASRCDRSPATRRKKKKKKPALGTEHAPKPSSALEEFPGEESTDPRGSREAAGSGNPFSLEPGEI